MKKTFLTNLTRSLFLLLLIASVFLVSSCESNQIPYDTGMSVSYDGVTYPVSEENARYIADLINNAEHKDGMYKYRYPYEFCAGNVCWQYAADVGAFYNPTQEFTFLINESETARLSEILAETCTQSASQP